MARVVCVTPPVFGTLPSITIPLMGTGLTAQPMISYSGGAAGCEATTALLTQLSPMFGALGIPICVLGCISAIMAVITALGDAVASIPPDFTKLIKAIANIPKACACVLEFATPPPVGAICDFMKMLAGAMTLIDQVLTCEIGLIEGILTIEAKGAALLADPLTAAAGQCAQTTSQEMMNTVNAKLGSLTTLTAAITPILQLLEIVPGVATALNPVIAGIGLISGNVPGTSPAATLAGLQSFKTILDTAVTDLNAITAICP